MYEYPYGGEQQLNLNWIISEIIKIHKTLDPDYVVPTFDNTFPFTNLNALNLDWILKELRTIKDLAPTEDATILKMVANAFIAASYDPDNTYNAGDIVYHDADNRIYICNFDGITGGFDPDDWDEITIGAALTYLLLNIGGSTTSDNVSNESNVTGVTVTDALDTLAGLISGLAASNISNDSNVTGATAKDALNNLNGAITSEAATRANADTALQNTLNNIGTAITGEYLSNEIPNATVTDTMSVTLTNGTWIIFGYFNYGSSFTTGRGLAYLLQGGNTLTQLNNDNGAPGGGAFPVSTLIIITDSSPSKTIRLSAYQSSGAQQTITTRRLNAVRIK